ncbi:class I SAM-dependent RNA methyltransferase [Amorphus sp. 3PC139-8]
MTVTIDALGHHGDGIVRGDPPIYVPRTLAGETVDIEVSGSRATLLAVKTPSPDRVEPPCPHFGSCGGCALQHMAEPAYRAWKRELVLAALTARGFATPIDSLISARPHTRRRAVLSAEARGRSLALGYHERSSHSLVDIQSCLVLTPGLEALLPALRTLAKPFQAKGGLRLTVTETETGIDLAIEGGREPDPTALATLTETMHTAGIARLSHDGEAVIMLTEPVVAIGPARVGLPPAAFLQATQDAEHALADHVTAAAAGAKSAVDLFSGLGTFALRLAQDRPVHMVESERALVEAGQAAARRTSGLKQVTGEVRDLFTFPLATRELDRYDLVVFDPPRAGAAAQAAEIAACKAKTVVAVSCNPATLARDLRSLVDGGYRIETVTAVDQFLYAPHIEVVAVLRR